MKKVISFFIISLFTIGSINAQITSGDNLIGPSLGLSWAGASFVLGANYENIIPIEGVPGKIGIGGIFRYFSYDESRIGYGWDYTVISIGAQGNYHFILKNKKLVPYAGIAFGYQSRSWDEPAGWPDYADPDSGGLFIGLHAGLRYFINPNIALNARIAEGNFWYGGFDVGVDFKF